MNNTTRIGIDLAKNIFQLCLTDEHGRVIKNFKLKRVELLAFIAQQSPCVIILEACATANYWARQFSEFGHTVKLIHPRYVRP
jgi:transposase